MVRHHCWGDEVNCSAAAQCVRVHGYLISIQSVVFIAVFSPCQFGTRIGSGSFIHTLVRPTLIVPSRWVRARISDNCWPLPADQLDVSVHRWPSRALAAEWTCTELRTSLSGNYIPTACVCTTRHREMPGTSVGSGWWSGWGRGGGGGGQPAPVVSPGPVHW